MNVIPYENLTVTTMTIVMALTGEVDIGIAFQLLPITRIVIQQKRSSSKCKIPHCETPGAILSMRFKGKTRGIIRNKSRSFKNAIIIDISTTKKNISVKLSGSSIQMCGASSREDGVEAASHLLAHLKSIQSILNKIQGDVELARRTVEWVKNVTQGDRINRVIYEERHFVNLRLRICRTSPDHSIKNDLPPIPNEIDEDIALFFLPLCDDFIYHGDMCRKLDYILGVSDIIKEPLGIKGVEDAMVNYNYPLGFRVHRMQLNELIDGRNSFVSRYNNALSNSVTVELSYEQFEDNGVIKRKKNKVPHHTFLIYGSGSVTQSGPGGPLMREAYYLFTETVARLYPLIQYVP